MRKQIALCAIFVIFLNANMHASSPNIAIRKFPYPYSAMLSICSDIDDTTPREFENYHRFLNTKEDTPLGQGLGLDVADSFWFFNMNDRNNPADAYGGYNKDVMSFFKKDSGDIYKDALVIAYYYHAGWIDTIHSYGDFNASNVNKSLFNASYAKKALYEMNKYDMLPSVWINHGNAANIQNFGTEKKSSNYQQGDMPGSLAYHMNLSPPFKFVWNSMYSSKFGNDCPIFKLQLQNGQKIWGFSRYSGDIVNKKQEFQWSPYCIQNQLTKQHLDSLVEKKQYSIVAQHLGNRNTYRAFGRQQVAALRLLKQYSDDKEILVTRTTRLLKYCVAQNYVSCKIQVDKSGNCTINITSIKDPVCGEFIPSLDDVRGLTFYTENPENTKILLSNIDITKETVCNGADETGQKSISIKWFPPDTRNFSKIMRECNVTK